MTHSDVIWQWLDGQRGSSHAMRTDGNVLTYRGVPVAEHRKAWKTVAILNRHNLRAVAKVLARVKTLCHTLAFTNVGTSRVGSKPRKEILCPDQ